MDYLKDGLSLKLLATMAFWFVAVNAAIYFLIPMAPQPWYNLLRELVARGDLI